jgi:hypothetical protein
VALRLLAPDADAGFRQFAPRKCRNAAAPHTKRTALPTLILFSEFPRIHVESISVFEPDPAETANEHFIKRLKKKIDSSLRPTRIAGNFLLFTQCNVSATTAIHDTQV